MSGYGSWDGATPYLPVSRDWQNAPLVKARKVLAGFASGLSKGRVRCWWGPHYGLAGTVWLLVGPLLSLVSVSESLAVGGGSKAISAVGWAFGVRVWRMRLQRDKQRHVATRRRMMGG